ncbi:MAG: hypothetical protein Q8942_02685 [Bacillota bacterium]|nr:hypothetical protein [Bacillota bacterium]
MFEFLKKSTSKRFDRRTLRKNNISLLILDERWNQLFANTAKTVEVEARENRVKELLKLHSRLFAEAKEIAERKKDKMARIIHLTPDAFDRDKQEAKDEMKACEQEILKINERLPQIEKELEEIPDQLNEANLELLESAVNLVYYKMRTDQNRIKELEGLIEETSTKLEKYIKEKEELSTDDSGTYSYFHDLLGPEELERLDNEFQTKSNSFIKNIFKKNKK